MSVSPELPQQYDQAYNESFDVMPSHLAHKLIEDAELPLREDGAHKEAFYGAMGVVRTELSEGAAVQGRRVLYKDERVQPSNSYKSRGASMAVLSQDSRGTAVTWSTGNHGFSVVLAAERAGCAGVVVEATATMSAAKLALYDGHAAQVHNVHRDFAAAEQTALQTAAQPDHFAVPPFGSPEVVAGQCTLGEELVQDLIERGLADKHVVVPVAVAGGGQIAGFALPIKRAKDEGRLGPNVQVVAVQPEGTDTMNRALKKLDAGEVPTGLYQYDTQDRACDALVIGEQNLSPLTMSLVGDPEYVSTVVTVSQAAIGRAMVALESELGGTVEPAAALPRAFADTIAGHQDTDEQVVFVLPVSGGNCSQATADHYASVVARDDFRNMSDAYAARSESVYQEIARHLRHANSDSKAPREVAYAALSGLTARYRTGLVTPTSR